ncbi:hypothetical protein R3P38DRAFT_2635398 [Favolaschia claudopus]|uniref:Uncharacterized protein n=1 Tax=Favolaschia claudopus TaxID=2862362 RepID=A0AAW0AVE8_9AGAR
MATTTMNPVLDTLGLILVSLVSGVLSMLITLAIVMPFAGALVRFRANYTPKTGAVRLTDGEHAASDGRARDADSAVDATFGYFGMFARVWRLERWAGLYKGSVPTLISTLIAFVVILPVAILFGRPRSPWAYPTEIPSSTPFSHFLTKAAPPPPHILLPQIGLHYLAGIIAALLLIPLQILINRAITTPYILPLRRGSTRTALRALLSPAERAKPLRLYLAPGVALGVLCESLIAPALVLLRAATRALPGGFHLAGAIPSVLLAVLLGTPLAVAVVRLTLQRRAGEGSGEGESEALLGAAGGEGGGQAPLERYTPLGGESVLEVRDDAAVTGLTGENGGETYTGLVDCLRKVVREEGWGVLARAWWVQLFGAGVAWGGAYAGDRGVLGRGVVWFRVWCGRGGGVCMMMMMRYRCELALGGKELILFFSVYKYPCSSCNKGGNLYVCQMYASRYRS